MSQNSTRIPWTREQTLEKLEQIMLDIHHQCLEHADDGVAPNYVRGANIAGFMRLADALLAQGHI
jgi:glutamate dehydrogenase (NADP+)